MSPIMPPPPAAAWRHEGSRSGFEVAYVVQAADGWRITGWTAALDDGRTSVVHYSIVVDGGWRTRSAHVTRHDATGTVTTALETDGVGRWRVDGAAAPLLTGCLDVDLESSAMTNCLPMRRLNLAVGDRAAAPAAYVGVPDLDVAVLEQTYARVPDDGARSRFDYSAPAFDFTCLLVYDDAGLVLDYPGIAVRAG